VRTLSASFILGYHGCDSAVAERVLAGDKFQPSQNDYDWLGPGIYFWEANPLRGLDYAHELSSLSRSRGPKIKNPTVIGAVIDLGRCLDLTTAAGAAQVSRAYKTLREMIAASGGDAPKNSPDLLRRNLDCAVIRVLHGIRESEKSPALETIRGVFVEGSPLYSGGGIYAKTHIQICVCDPANIKGVFRVAKEFLA
jgi:hypothetical protein